MLSTNDIPLTSLRYPSSHDVHRVKYVSPTGTTNLSLRPYIVTVENKL